MTESKGKNVALLVLTIALVSSAFYIGNLTARLDAADDSSKDVLAGNAPAGAAPAAPSPTEDPAGEVAPVTEDDYVKGNRDAKIALIEYSDYECPYCARFHPTAQQALDEFGDDLMWVFRQFPLTAIHSGAQAKAIAAECAGSVGGNEAFWAFTDYIYDNIQTTVEQIPEVAETIGVDAEAFKECVTTTATADNVTEDLSTGAEAGVRGTPGNIVLNLETGESTLIPGALPYAQLKTAIESVM